jgi:polysaccharide pyruvyl transferase WcaK-like protein
MIIEIRGAGFANKGSELMLQAILRKTQSSLEDVTFTMAPDLGPRPYRKLAALGIHPKAWLHRYGIQWGYLANRFPRKLLQMYGIVSDSQVDVVLDASGFAYGDQWGPRRTVGMARATRKWRRQGTKIILLPQAFGPFRTTKIGRFFEIVVENADRVYARDPVSLGYVRDCCGIASHIRESPDFTVLIPGQTPDSFEEHDHDVAIIPNGKMIEKTSSSTREAYLPFLVTCLRHFSNSGCRPFFLIHGGPKDEELARTANRVFGQEVPVIVLDDPVKIKGVIGTCRAVVSSRYHGLINALSQGIPAIGTGWSHKYETLFDYYGCPEMLVSPNDSATRLKSAMSTIVSQRDEIAVRLQKHAIQHADAVNRMWNDVLNLIEDKR